MTRRRLTASLRLTRLVCAQAGRTPVQWISNSSPTVRTWKFHSTTATILPSGFPEQYAPWQPAKAIAIADLTRFGPAPLDARALIESAEFTRKDLPHRLLRRVRAHHGLPYLPASNPKLTEVMEIYQTSLAEFQAQEPITSLEQNAKFVEKLEKMVDAAAGVIPTLAKGFQESKQYLSSEQINSFLDRAIRNRIAIRLIAEQHLALSHETDALMKKSVKPGYMASNDPPMRVGIVETQLKVSRLIYGVASYVSQLCESTYGQAPDWIVDGEVDARVCYIGMHLEYILTEILKNAFRATVEHQRQVTGSSSPDLPPVVITLATNPDAQVLHLPTQSKPPVHSPNDAGVGERTSILTIRVRDCGGGIDPAHMDDVFSYAFTTVKVRGQDDEVDGMESGGGSGTGGMYETMTTGISQTGLSNGLGTLAGLGYGLPMARTYAKYFGGGLELVTMHGKGGGVDAFVTLRLGPSY